MIKHIVYFMLLSAFMGLPAGAQVSAQASDAVTFQSGQSVCNVIQRYQLDPDWTLQCFEAIKGRSYDSKIITLLEKVARYNREQTIAVLGVISGRRYEANAVAVCHAVEQFSADMAHIADCLKNTSDRRYADGLSSLAAKVARYEPSQANEIMRIAGNVYLHPEALRICAMIQERSPGMVTVTNCILAIVDKTFPAGQETLCRQFASSGFTSEAAIQCLKGNMVAYDFPIMIRNSDLQRVLGLVQGAREQLKEGRVDQADRSLNSAGSHMIRWMWRR
jgi:hypothetical protein